ncbi:hypothetical protein TNCV_4637251 [Trichonephila clavipes]|nr:hypothetical protein TNCV_4637251 [Trichonephila clavipes]
MKHGYPIALRNQSNSRWNSDTHLSRQGQSASLWQQCSGTGSVFCKWTLCKKERLSTRVPTAQFYGSSEEHCKTNGAPCCQKLFCSSTIRQGHTLLERIGS